jgi:predicted nucleic acid-binding protein
MVALDTNILLYVFDARDPVRQSRASELLYSLTDGVLLWQVAVEFVAASRKLAPPTHWPATAWKHLDDIRLLLPLLTPTSNTLTLAQTLTSTHQLQFWDALIYAACLDARIETLYSEDVPARAIDGLKIINPFA